MRIVRPYGESIASGAGHDRLLRIRQRLQEKIGDPPERAIPAFAESHDELVIAQWISTIDRIATKPRGQDRPTRAQRDLRKRLGQAAWRRLVEHDLLQGQPNDSDDKLRKLWWSRIHPYPEGEARPRWRNGEPLPDPDPRGRWYARFAGDAAPGAIDADAVAARIHEHLHEAEYRLGTESRRAGGRIARRAESIAKNVASLDQVTKTPSSWDDADVEQYRRTAGDVAADIKAAAEAQEAAHRRVGADTAAAVLHPAFGRLFPGKGIEQALAEAPGLAALHLAIRDLYRRRLKRHKKDRKEHGDRRRPVSATQPATLDGLAALLGHASANREVAALIRLGKVLHYEAGLHAAVRVGGPSLDEGDAPAHVLEHWPDDVAASVLWSSAGQAAIKRNEAFVRIWRHALALAAQTARDWADPAGTFDDDVLLGKGLKELPPALDLQHHARKLAVLLGSRSGLFLDERDEDFQRRTLELALRGLAQLRHNSFHFNGLGGFAQALRLTVLDKKTGQPKVAAEGDLWQALRDLWQADQRGRGERLVDTLEAAQLDHFFDWPRNKRLMTAVVRAKRAEAADDLPLPRFRRLLDRAANIRGRKGINLRLPLPVNRQKIEESPALHAQYVGLKLLYEHPFRQWLAVLDRATVNQWIDRAVLRDETAAKDLHGGKDEDRRQIITARAKDLGRLAERENLHKFYFRLSRETAAEMQVQRDYESDRERAKEQAGFIEELLIDVLAQGFDRYLEEKRFGFLVELRADEPLPDAPKGKLLRPKLDDDAAAEWQLLLYFLLHLVPVDDVGRLLHQIRKWKIVAGKATDAPNPGDADVGRVVRTLTLYLDMHDAKFTGNQALQVLEPFRNLYASPETFDRVFPARSVDDDERLPRRGLREIMRFGHLPPLRHLFDAHKVEDAAVDVVLAAEEGPIAAAQREREALHETWARRRKEFNADDLQRYVEVLAAVTRHRHAAAHVQLVNHVRLHRLMMAVLGRLLDFAGLFERDLYFAMLALIYQKGLSPKQTLSDKGIERLEDGRIIEARRKLKDEAIEQELARLFGPPYGAIIDIRNDFAHFNMLNVKRSGGAPIDLTAAVNEARRMMVYDRKLKNAVAQSVIELVEREGLELKWRIEARDGRHHLARAEVSGRQAKHLGKTALRKEAGRGKKDRGQPVTESLHGGHLVEMAAMLFAGTAVAPGVPDVASLPLLEIDWQASVAGK